MDQTSATGGVGWLASLFDQTCAKRGGGRAGNLSTRHLPRGGWEGCKLWTKRRPRGPGGRVTYIDQISAKGERRVISAPHFRAAKIRIRNPGTRTGPVNLIHRPYPPPYLCQEVIVSLRSNVAVGSECSYYNCTPPP
jgi:hypothetical protein